MKGILMMMPVMSPPMMETAREMPRTVSWMPAWFMMTMLMITMIFMMTIMLITILLMMTCWLAVYPGPASTEGSSA